eukprot:30828-Pelagococcus_subviridis.AAC.4
MRRGDDPVVVLRLVRRLMRRRGPLVLRITRFPIRDDPFRVLFARPRAQDRSHHAPRHRARLLVAIRGPRRDAAQERVLVVERRDRRELRGLVIQHGHEHGERVERHALMRRALVTAHEVTQRLRGVRNALAGPRVPLAYELDQKRHRARAKHRLTPGRLPLRAQVVLLLADPRERFRGALRVARPRPAPKQRDERRYDPGVDAPQTHLHAPQTHLHEVPLRDVMAVDAVELARAHRGDRARSLDRDGIHAVDAHVHQPRAGEHGVSQGRSIQANVGVEFKGVRWS